MKITILGGGNMGMTYAQSFLRNRIVSAENLMVLCRTPERAAQLSPQCDGMFCSNPAECIAQADILVLAVKPQDAPGLFAQLAGLTHPEQIAVSIMAGIRMEAVTEALNMRKVIRAMPNLPAQIGAGVTAFTSSDAVTRLELIMIQNLLNATGKTLYVTDESMIDAATAISGSGPAYVFYFMQSMMEAARQMGFSEAEAELLVSQTFTGAVDLYNKTDLSCQEWIARVASKGGTTEAALGVFSEADLDESIRAGARAAWLRATALGKQGA